MLRIIVLVLYAHVFLPFLAPCLAGEQAGSSTQEELEKSFVKALGRESSSEYRKLFHPASVQAALAEPSPIFENYFDYHFRTQVSTYLRMSSSWRKAISEGHFHMRALIDDKGMLRNSLRFFIPPTHLLAYSSVDGRKNLIVLEEYAVYEEGRWMFVAPLPPQRVPERSDKDLK
jgi:hypothetical protein